MKIFYFLFSVFVSFSLDTAVSSRISQQSPSSEDREGDLRQTLMYCKSVTVFLQPDDNRKGNVNDFGILGEGFKDRRQKSTSTSLNVPPYVGGYLSSYEAPANNLGGQLFESDISNEDQLYEGNIVETDIDSFEYPLGAGGKGVPDLDILDVTGNTGLKVKSAVRSSARDACYGVCCDAVSAACDECGCSRDLEKDFKKSCMRACRNEF